MKTYYESTVNMDVEPIRTEEIVALSVFTKRKYKRHSIRQVAEAEGIRLIIEEAASPKLGITHCEPCIRVARAPSLVDPRFDILIRGRYERRWYPVIFLNLRSLREHSVAIESAFWHEYYHALYSPVELRKSIPTVEDEAAYQFEEERANEFAALMMVDSVNRNETADDITKRCQLAPEIANAAVRLWDSHATTIDYLRTP